MKVIEIIREHIKAKGFDGLVNGDAECGCELGDLAPCGDYLADCSPAYKRAGADALDWTMTTTKPDPALEAIGSDDAPAQEGTA